MSGSVLAALGAYLPNAYMPGTPMRLASTPDIACIKAGVAAFLICSTRCDGLRGLPLDPPGSLVRLLGLFDTPLSAPILRMSSLTHPLRGVFVPGGGKGAWPTLARRKGAVESRCPSQGEADGHWRNHESLDTK